MTKSQIVWQQNNDSIVKGEGKFFFTDQFQLIMCKKFKNRQASLDFLQERSLMCAEITG